MRVPEYHAINTIAHHIRKLATLTDDTRAMELILDAARRLSDRAQELAQKKPQQKDQPK